ncbi:hypothetical protein BCV69DRAFT_301118 [Microstroma glucosiphilum]|uniref:YTH domain-containing protein n=1 Tax=Pseudomicrostroma glucosiphilum TaxID=1684307 RepID=A0A316TZW2_9BASI|nr:hypothetical protein BCV69DRAFT_301118 [Pseudomicrostroma glucosiphilum]PWN18637.1 hypothetical protein BCV69DRAFT_301118 [Pseudomicrostroma glucosiphilum]
MATPPGPPTQSYHMSSQIQPSEQLEAPQIDSQGGLKGQQQQTTYRPGDVETGMRPGAAPLAYSGPTSSGGPPKPTTSPGLQPLSTANPPMSGYMEPRPTQPATSVARGDAPQHTTFDSGAKYGTRLPSQSFMTGNTFPGAPPEQTPAYYGFANFQPYPAYYASATPGNVAMAPQVQQMQSTGLGVPQGLVYGQQYPSYYNEGQLHAGYGAVHPAPADYQNWHTGSNLVYSGNANVMSHQRQGSFTEDPLDPSFGGQVLGQTPYASAFNSNTPQLQQTGTMQTQRRTSPLSTSGRRSEHRPADTRSEHVMWVGNVPTDATQEELWSIFSTLPPLPQQDQEGEQERERWPHGILSIFIIARSNCAFVNYTTPDYLTRAVEFFHGKSLRPHDARCPKLVCRIRKKDEEAAAGVAGQRGKGIHVAWLKEHNRRLETSRRTDPASSSQSPSTSTAAVQVSGGLAPPHERFLSESASVEPSSGTATPRSGPRAPPAAEASSFERTAFDQTQSASDPSYASTNSEVLSHRAFSKRYFHLKSHNVEELDRAVETKTWTTQPHNESFLDQAFRHSEVVYLFFSANQSGRFYGYARMTGGIPSDAKQQGLTVSGLSHPSVDTLAPTTVVKDSPPPMTPPEELETPASTEVKMSSEEAEKPLTQTWPIGREVRERKTSSADGAADISGDSSAGGGIVHSDSSKNYRLRARDRQRRNNDEPGTSKADEVKGDSPQKASVASGLDPVSPQSSDRRPSSGGRPSSWTSSADLVEDLDRTLDFSSSPRESRAAEQHITRSLIHNLRLDQIDSQEKVLRLQRTLDEPHGQSVDAADEGQGQRGLSTASPVGSGKATPLSPAHPFTIEWLQTIPLPFGVVKHLRNPWNENKSVRVGRDGTELAVETGAELLRIWDDHVGKQEVSNSRRES